MKKAALALDCVGGGHDIAAGATIPIGKEEEFLEILEKEIFDLVLMDGQMPIMDGFQATREIRSREENSDAHIPIIAMTACAMEGDRERCLESGMDDYVTKPVKPKDLAAVIDKWIDHPTQKTKKTA